MDGLNGLAGSGRSSGSIVAGRGQPIFPPIPFTEKGSAMIYTNEGVSEGWRAAAAKSC